MRCRPGSCGIGPDIVDTARFQPLLDLAEAHGRDDEVAMLHGTDRVAVAGRFLALQLAPVRSSVHIPAATLWAHFQSGDVDAGLAELEAPARTMIDDLLWWTRALKAARATAS